MKIVMAPVNIAGQPIVLVNELRRLGIDISLVQYTGTGVSHKLKYDTDRIVQYGGGNRSEVQLDTVANLLREGVDVFHFWLRSLYFSGIYEGMTGFDIPVIRHYGRNIVYRFTGEDLRIRSVHIARNPHNAYQYGYTTKIDEDRQRRYIDFLRENVDRFVVQDPEMHEFCPEAAIIPRVIDLDAYPAVGPKNTDRPLVVHAPTSPMVKGTQFVRKAVQNLQTDGLSFEYREISGLAHDAAVQLYRSADIIIDQLHIGWYGVLAIEGMALAKTVIGYVRPDFLDSFKPKIPIISANPLDIEQVLRATIRDPERRREVGQQGRTYVEAVHDVHKVAPALVSLYDRLPVKEVVQPAAFATLEYFRHQRLIEREQLIAALRKARAYDSMRAKLADASAPTAWPNQAKLDAATSARIEKALMEMRYKARRYDEQKEELPALRYKARLYDEQKEELPLLRYKAKQYEKIEGQLPILRAKADRYDRLTAVRWRKRWLSVIALLFSPLSRVRRGWPTRT